MFRTSCVALALVASATMGTHTSAFAKATATEATCRAWLATDPNPAGFHTAATPVVVIDLHGTGDYPEAEWNDWHAAMTARGCAFIGLLWDGGTPSA